MISGKKVVALFGIVCACLFVKAETTSAQIVRENETARIDLDGDGTKEKIQIVTSGENPCVAKIYVNNRMIYSSKSNYALWATLSVIDINKKDKYKEMYLQFCSDSDCFEQGVCGRYVNGKWKKYFVFHSKDAASYRLGVVEKQPGNGKVSVSIEFSNPYAMQGDAVQTYVIDSKGNLKNNGKTILNTTSDWRKNLYRTTKAVKVTKKIGDKTAAFTMKKGTHYYVYKVKLKAANNSQITHIYIKTADGKTGWVKIPNSSFCEGHWGDGEWSEYAYTWG